MDPLGAGVWDGVPTHGVWDGVPTQRLIAPCPLQHDAAGRYRVHVISQGVCERGGAGMGKGAERGRGEWKVACEAVWLRDVHEAAVACCTWAPDGVIFASGDVGGTVVVCGARDGAEAQGDGPIVKCEIKKWQVRRHSRRVVALAFSKSGVLILKKQKICI